MLEINAQLQFKLHNLSTLKQEYIKRFDQQFGRISKRKLRQSIIIGAITRVTW